MSYSVKIRVDVFGSDGIPHTFLTITDSLGNETSWGYGPINPNAIEQGVVKEEDHEYQVSSSTISITETQYNDLMKYINETTANPRDYNVLIGAECAAWAMGGLQEAKIIDQLAIPDYTTVDKFGIPLGIMQTLIYNPYTQALGFLYQKGKEGISEFIDQIIDGAILTIKDLTKIITAFANPKPIEISISDTTANEKKGTITFTININQPLDKDFTFNVTTIDGSATGNVDYMSVPNGTITIKAGETEATYSIAIASDGIYENSEEFMLYAHYEQGTYTGYDLGKVTGGTGVGTITDDIFEGACPTTVSPNFGFNFDVPTPVVSASSFFTCKPFSILKALHVKRQINQKGKQSGAWKMVA